MDRTGGEGGGRRHGIRGSARRGGRRGGVKGKGGDREADVVFSGRKEMSKIILLHVDWDLEMKEEAERKM